MGKWRILGGMIDGSGLLVATLPKPNQEQTQADHYPTTRQSIVRRRPQGPASRDDWGYLLRRRTGDRAPHHQIDRPDLAAGALFQARYPGRQALGDALAGETDG